MSFSSVLLLVIGLSTWGCSATPHELRSAETHAKFAQQRAVRRGSARLGPPDALGIGARRVRRAHEPPTAYD